MGHGGLNQGLAMVGSPPGPKIKNISMIDWFSKGGEKGVKIIFFTRPFLF
jgi:hypothetical protein